MSERPSPDYVRCCDDCGDVVKRRTRCVECGSFTCPWCFHHHMHIGRKPARAMPNPDYVLCIYCGRRGTRGFLAVHSRDDDYVDQWCCASRAACERRQRAEHIDGSGAQNDGLGAACE